MPYTEKLIIIQKFVRNYEKYDAGFQNILLSTLNVSSKARSQLKPMHVPKDAKKQVAALHKPSHRKKGT